MKYIMPTISSQIFRFLILVATLSSCAVPVNLNFESSRMLEKGNLELQGSGSYYKAELDQDSPFNLNQLNVGGKIGFGVSDKYNVKVKVEGLFTLINSYNEENLFLEIDNKLRLSKWAAVSLPIGIYITSLGFAVIPAFQFYPRPAFQFDPRFYLTYTASNKFELTLIPKCHIFGFQREAIFPGISIGAGFSNDLNKWSIRPEVGFDRLSLSAGISFSYCFKKND